MLPIVIAAILSFVMVIVVMPSTIRMLKEKGMIGIDVHKIDRPEIAKGGGFIVLFALVTSLLVVIGMNTFISQGTVNPGLLAALVSILIAGMIGLLDDNLDFKNRTKIALPIVASIPMVVMQVGTTTMSIPLIGTLDLGIIYPLVVIPLLMTFIIDSTNMYGGMNGLEAGLASINASAIVVFIILTPILAGAEMTSRQQDAGIVAAALLGAMLAFLIFNRYPAKILPGDVGRLPIGATIAVALILGNMDRLAIILYLPFLLNFILYLVYKVYVKRKEMDWVKFASPREDGTLEVVGPFTLYWILPWFSKNITEKRNVQLLLLIQALVAFSGLFMLLIARPLGIVWI
ncbi:MAG: hypothetical protein ACTSUO_07975 [Candidatus Thorarchaeota archaeon]